MIGGNERTDFIFLMPPQSGILDPLLNTLKYCADLPWTNLKRQVAKQEKVCVFLNKIQMKFLEIGSLEIWMWNQVLNI